MEGGGGGVVDRSQRATAAGRRGKGRVARRGGRGWRERGGGEARRGMGGGVERRGRGRPSRLGGGQGAQGVPVRLGNVAVRILETTMSLKLQLVNL